MNCNRRLPPPAELIALKREKETWLCWQPVPGAAGYDVYARPNEAADGNYSGLQYRKVNGAPVEGCEFCDENRNVTYRVAAVDENGASSELSDMVFPIGHEGLELLSIRYYSGERLLTQLPDADVRVAVTAINATACEEAVSLEAEWDGQRRTFALSIPNDGKASRIPRQSWRGIRRADHSRGIRPERQAHFLPVQVPARRKSAV